MKKGRPPAVRHLVLDWDKMKRICAKNRDYGKIKGDPDIAVLNEKFRIGKCGEKASYVARISTRRVWTLSGEEVTEI